MKQPETEELRVGQH